MAHAQKQDFVFPRNGRVHLNWWGRQFSRLLAAEVCASAWVMLDIPLSEVAWEYWLPTPFASFPFTSPPVRHRVPPGYERALRMRYCLCGCKIKWSVNTFGSFALLFFLDSELVTISKKHAIDASIWNVPIHVLRNTHWTFTLYLDGFSGLVVTMLAYGTQVCGFKPGRSRWIFTAVKILSMPSSGGEVKESVPCPSFAACKRT